MTYFLLDDMDKRNIFVFSLTYTIRKLLIRSHNHVSISFLFKQVGFTPHKGVTPLPGM